MSECMIVRGWMNVGLGLGVEFYPIKPFVLAVLFLQNLISRKRYHRSD